MWDYLIVDPLTNLLLLFYQLLGNQTMLAVAALTLLVRLLLTPLTLSQQKMARKQQELQPRMKALQEKYKNDRERLAQEQMALYKELGINPLGGCLPMLIQLPLMFALYGAIIRALASDADPLLICRRICHLIPASVRWPPNGRFPWMIWSCAIRFHHAAVGDGDDPVSAKHTPRLCPLRPAGAIHGQSMLIPAIDDGFFSAVCDGAFGLAC